MTYVHVTGGVVDGRQRNRPRTLRVGDSLLVAPSDEDLAAAGWLPLVDADRPADTDTSTHVDAIQIIDGAPTVVWTPRPWTADEQAARAAGTNRVDRTARLDQVRAKARAVAQGETTFTAAERDRLLAFLTLDRLND